MLRLSDADVTEIKEAVARAERTTSGEIVPFIAEQSGRYEVAFWRAAGGFGFGALVLIVLAHWFYHGWGLAWLYTGWGAVLVIALASAAGALLAYIPAARRFFAGTNLLAETVHAAATAAFLEQEVFSTRERTGILIYISLFEHRIEVMGDSGINRRVTAEDWAAVVTRIRKGIREGKLAEGLVEALGMCGVLLERSGVTLRADDANELPDEVQLRRKRR